MGEAPLCVSVSIRSRLLGREEPLRLAAEDAAEAGFNPLPAVRPGGTRFDPPKAPVLEVSIRSRLLGREERWHQ